MAHSECEVAGVTCSVAVNILCLLLLLLCISNCERGGAASHKRKFDPGINTCLGSTAPIASMGAVKKLMEG